MQTNLMIDLETMGIKPGCAIASIGAVRFSAKGLSESFYRRVELQSCLDVGLEFDATTVLWWLQQSDAARAEICKNGSSLDSALLDFHDFMLEDECVWGNGSDFDNVILAAAFAALDCDLPWRFRNNRCYRTVKNLFPEIPMERSGTHHNALDDAKSQALHLIKMIGPKLGDYEILF